MLYAVAMLTSVALVLVNAFFVAAEFAIVKIRPSRLEQLAARASGGRGSHSASRAGSTRTLCEPARYHAGIAGAWMDW